MAFPASNIPSASLRDVLNNAWGATKPNLTSDTFNVALYNNSVTATIDSDGGAGTGQAYDSTGWHTFEVTGTGWGAGGVALASNTLVRTSTVGVTFTAGNVSVAGTTLASIQGCVIYDTTTSSYKGIFAAINFGGTYATSAGTFGITWSGSGIWFIQLH